MIRANSWPVISKNRSHFCTRVQLKVRAHMECGDLSPLWSERRKESGDKSDKSPHSKEPIHRHVSETLPQATRTSNCTLCTRSF